MALLRPDARAIWFDLHVYALERNIRFGGSLFVFRCLVYQTARVLSLWSGHTVLEDALAPAYVVLLLWPSY